MNSQQQITRQHKISTLAIIFLIVSILLCSFFVYISIINRNKLDNFEIEQLLLEKSVKIQDVIIKHLHKAETLSVLVRQGGGDISDFEMVAASLIDDPAIWTMLIAPDGIVTQVYPLAGNEAMLGLDLFGTVIDNSEAILARDSRQLVMGGPFNAVQGGQTLVGRMPVYIDTETGESKFWGLVSVSLRFPDALNNADINYLDSQGYAYELWRINPNTNEKQIIAGNNKSIHSSFAEKQINILNAEWYITASAVRHWYDYPVNIILVAASLFISTLIFFVMQSNYKLKQMRDELENVAKTDALTGLYNRRFFLELSNKILAKSQRLNESCYVIMYDLDKFKAINDTYGHQIGDKVLMEASARMSTQVRPYDCIARYGGEEFIILAASTDDVGVTEMAERLRLCLCEKTFDIGDISLNVSASFGIAHIHDYDIDKAIKNADDALYMAKEAGRNNIILKT